MLSSRVTRGRSGRRVMSNGGLLAKPYGNARALGPYTPKSFRWRVESPGRILYRHDGRSAVATRGTRATAKFHHSARVDNQAEMKSYIRSPLYRHAARVPPPPRTRQRKRRSVPHLSRRFAASAAGMHRAAFVRPARHTL